MIALIGSEGSMGTRYKAILNYLQEPFTSLDTKLEMPKDKIIERAKACEKIIIATPTHTHLEYLRELLPTKKSILCEKPITKSLDQLNELHTFCARSGLKYSMVMQYKELSGLTSEPGRASSYNYFRSGDDGLAWDCIQIIALARGPISLRNDSPTWECVINGKTQNIRDMDYAYIAMTKKWLEGSLDQSLDEILKAHQKVLEFEASRLGQPVETD